MWACRRHDLRLLPVQPETQEREVRPRARRAPGRPRSDRRAAITTSSTHRRWAKPACRSGAVDAGENGVRQHGRGRRADRKTADAGGLQPHEEGRDLGRRADPEGVERPARRSPARSTRNSAARPRSRSWTHGTRALGAVRRRRGAPDATAAARSRAGRRGSGPRGWRRRNPAERTRSSEPREPPGRGTPRGSTVRAGSARGRRPHGGPRRTQRAAAARSRPLRTLSGPREQAARVRCSCTATGTSDGIGRRGGSRLRRSGPAPPPTG